MQVDVTEDRRDHGSLRAPAERVAVFPVFKIPGFQHVSYKPKKPLVLDLLCQNGQHDLVVKRSKAVRDITFNEPHGPGPGAFYLPQCGMAPSFSPEPVRPVRELRFVVRLKNEAHDLSNELV